MHQFAQFMVTIFLESLYILLALVLVLTSPLIALAILPSLVLRLLVIKYIQNFKPNFGKIVTTRSSLVAVDGMYQNPKCNLCVVLTVEGDLTPEEFKEILVTKLLNAKLNENTPNKNELRHPELKMYIKKWFWYYFWKSDKNFNLENHVIIPNPDGRAFDEVEMLRYTTSLIEKSWPKKRSPWEFHLVRNFQPFEHKSEYGMTAILLRIHHSLADGYSVFNLLASSTETKFSFAKPVQVMSEKLPIWKVVLGKIFFLFRVPYDLVKCGIESYDINEWHNFSNQPKLHKSVNSGYHPLIPLSTLKDIKDFHKVSLSSVILEIFAGAIRNYMIKTNVKVPAKLHSLTALPLPGHSKKLRNFLTGCISELPVGISDPIERLYMIDKHLAKLKRSTIPWSGGFLLPLVGSLPSWLIKCFLYQRITTAVMTNFPGPDRTVDFFNRQLLELNFGGGLLAGNICVGMASISYNGNISIVIGLDKGICKEDSDVVGPSLVELISKEIECLQKLSV